MRPNRHLSLTSRTESRYNLRRMGIPINCHHTYTTRALDRIRTKPHWFFWLAFVVAAACLPDAARAQSPELSIREFSSGQMKKGVRSIGFGGDGATWGHYALVWRDAGTALFDYGDVHYTNGNDFHFVAVGATTPALWQHLAIAYHPNLGIDQVLGNGHVALRFGLEETSPTAGLSLKFSPYNLAA